MSTQTRTPVRAVRVPAGLWQAAQAKAAAEGRTLSEVIRCLLFRYVTRIPVDE